VLFVVGQRLESGNLSRREEALGERSNVQIFADVFHVNADLPPASHSIEGKPFGVGQVEPKRSIVVTGQGRLPIGSVVELHLSRFFLKVTTDQNSEKRARDDEAAAISLEAKPLGPLSFIRRKTIFKPFEVRG
jgi:hypothetical protein